MNIKNYKEQLIARAFKLGGRIIALTDKLTNPIKKYILKSKFYSRYSKPTPLLRRKRLLIMVAVIIFILIPATFLTLKYARPTIAAWWDDAWGYRQTVDITNAGSAQTDFQVVITLNTSALITAGKMQTNCNDIRITDANKKVLPIWIETNGLKACNQTTTKIWVKMPSVSTSGNTLYIYLSTQFVYKSILFLL